MNTYPNYPPYPTPPQQQMPQQQPPIRRQQIYQKKKPKPFNWILAIAVLVLFVIAIISFFSWTSANKQLVDLRKAREKEEAAWQNEVSLHQVKYRDLIEYYAALNSLDPAYVTAIIKRESNFNPNAVSSVGARGLMQIMPSNLEWFSHKVGLDGLQENQLFDPETNIKLACWYLNYLCSLFDGDEVLVTSAYHAGQNNVKSWLTKYSPDGVHLTVDEIPMSDTKNYVGKVLKSYAIYQQYVYQN